MRLVLRRPISGGSGSEETFHVELLRTPLPSQQGAAAAGLSVSSQQQSSLQSSTTTTTVSTTFASSAATTTYTASSLGAKPSGAYPAMPPPVSSEVARLEGVVSALATQPGGLTARAEDAAIALEALADAHTAGGAIFEAKDCRRAAAELRSLVKPTPFFAPRKLSERAAGLAHSRCLLLLLTHCKFTAAYVSAASVHLLLYRCCAAAAAHPTPVLVLVLVSCCCPAAGSDSPQHLLCYAAIFLCGSQFAELPDEIPLVALIHSGNALYLTPCVCKSRLLDKLRRTRLQQQITMLAPHRSLLHPRSANGRLGRTRQ